MAMTTKINTALTVDLNHEDLNQGSHSYNIVSSPSHGKLTGSGSNRTYTPDNNFTGDDEIRYVVQNDAHQSSISTIQLKVTQNTNTQTNSDSGGGSMPVTFIWLSMLLLITRKAIHSRGKTSLKI